MKSFHSTVRICLLGSIALLPLGCGPGGPATVPAKGTLTIGGQPANNVSITLMPIGAEGQEAAGQAKDGSFELYTGNKGTPGAMPGKYKVVLSALTTAEDAAASYNTGGARGRESAPPKVKLPFPEKYRTAATSDKEVEITKGSNDLKIDIPSE